MVTRASQCSYSTCSTAASFRTTNRCQRRRSRSQSPRNKRPLQSGSLGSISLLRGTGSPSMRCRPRPYRHILHGGGVRHLSLTDDVCSGFGISQLVPDYCVLAASGCPAGRSHQRRQGDERRASARPAPAQHPAPMQHPPAALELLLQRLRPLHGDEAQQVGVEGRRGRHVPAHARDVVDRAQRQVAPLAACGGWATGGGRQLG